MLATAIAVPPVTSLKPGIVAYLVKPFSQTGVVQAVARAAQWHALALARPSQPEDHGARLTKWLDEE